MTPLKLFLVEDSPLVRPRLLQELGEMGGVEVVGQATGARQACRALAEQVVHVLLLDLFLDQGHGLEVLAWVREVIPSLVVVVLSNHAGRQVRDRCLQLQADHVFDKSLEWREVMETVRRLRDQINQHDTVVPPPDSFLGSAPGGPEPRLDTVSFMLNDQAEPREITPQEQQKTTVLLPNSFLSSATGPQRYRLDTVSFMLSDQAEQSPLVELIAGLEERAAPAAPAHASPAEPTTQQRKELGWLGGFRLLELLGRGGMGLVFRAEDPHLQREVALKVLRPALTANSSARIRFLFEARAAAIEHDHIVGVHHVGEDCGVPFLTMALLRGETLESRLHRCQTLPMAEVIRIGRETAAGLAAAHRHGVAHRDIKPANLWLEERTDRVKILDFGVAHWDCLPPGMQSGALQGTAAYMAPEQARGERVDNRCDLFSLGCILYEMCTGRLPFHGKDRMSILVAAACDQPPAPTTLVRRLPDGLSQLILHLLAKDPADRPSSAEAVMEALDALGVDERTAPAGPSPCPQTSSGPRSGRGQLAVVIVLVLILLAAVLLAHLGGA